MILLKRAYSQPENKDGYRVLVDRLWPRGVSKEKAKIGLWLREIAPSNELRKWFSHEESKWPEFRKRYVAEMKSNGELIKELRALEKSHGTITLVFAAKDEARNNAVVLKSLL